MTATELYPRLVRARLREALADSPVVLLHGPRQCGKTTLARSLGKDDGRQYLTLDDAPTFAAIQADPGGFVLDLPDGALPTGPPPATDEGALGGVPVDVAFVQRSIDTAADQSYRF
jgi:hypothetical protein